MKVKVLVTQLCLTLCNPMDHSPPGSSVHGDAPGKNTGVSNHTLLRGIETLTFIYKPLCEELSPSTSLMHAKTRFLNFVPQSTQNSDWCASNLKSILAGLKWILINFIFLLPPAHTAQIGGKKFWNRNTTLAITIWAATSASRDSTNLILIYLFESQGS